MVGADDRGRRARSLQAPSGALPEHSIRASEPPLQPKPPRLGHATGERPLRAQLVIACVLGLVLLSIPLYLFRRPPSAPAATPSAAGAGGPGFGGVVSTILDAGAPEATAVRLGPVQRVRCGASRRAARHEGVSCDALPTLEQALARAIRENLACAPRTNKSGSINYVLEVDFERQHLNLFAGKSGSFRGPGARAAAKCVLRGLSAPRLRDVQHQHRYYAIAILATYPAPDPFEALPVFE